MSILIPTRAFLTTTHQVELQGVGALLTQGGHQDVVGHGAGQEVDQEDGRQKQSKQEEQDALSTGPQVVGIGSPDRQIPQINQFQNIVLGNSYRFYFETLAGPQLELKTSGFSMGDLTIRTTQP